MSNFTFPQRAGGLRPTSTALAPSDALSVWHLFYD